MVSYLEGQVTKDGRKRAPRHLFGANYRKPFPWIRVGLGLVVMAGAVDMAYRRLTYVSPQEQFIRKIKIRPYGVMGTQMTLQGSLRQEGPKPDETMVITDPCDLMQVFTSAAKATGTSGAIYKWIGLTKEFPNDVVMAMGKVCDAKLHRYGAEGKEGGEKHVIHVSAPDFREGIWSEREAAIELSRAYRNVLHEFVVSECDTLRMVPLSDGVQAGPLYNQLPGITHSALLMAFEQLHIFDREYVLRDKKNMELCVFMNREWDMFNNAFENLPVGAGH